MSGPSANARPGGPGPGPDPGPGPWRLTDDGDTYWSAALVRQEALAVGFDPQTAARVATAAAELVRNAIGHGGGGTLAVARLTEPAGIEIVVEDDGPGIEDPGAALRDGYSRGRPVVETPGKARLGSGLGAVSRLMDLVSVGNRPEGGTRVVARRMV